MALKLALEQLGLGPCYHMTEIIKNPGHSRLWRAVHSGQAVSWPALFASYRATVDWPACHYYRELMDAFPDAKVILTIRDPDQWYESMANTLYSLKTAADARLGARQERLGDGHAPESAPGRHIWADTFSGRFEDRAYAIEVFERHNAQVVQTVPAERLLVYQVSEGWPPLCGFLGAEPPPAPFPQINSTQSFREYNRAQLVRP
jgi:Sulfotransferase domain